MWNQFDNIFLINLPRRTDRLVESGKELSEHNIPYTVFPAIETDDGRYGIYYTLVSLFKESIKRGDKKILVFEDDVKILRPIDDVLCKAMNQLPDNFDMLYLGANIPHPVNAHRYSGSLMKVNRALALHAVVYSNAGMKKILSLTEYIPIDLIIANKIHPDGKSFCTYPMLATQRPGFSDIEKKNIDYRLILEGRFEKATKNYI